MKARHVIAALAMVAAGAVVGSVAPGTLHAAAPAQAPVSFKHDVQPIFQTNCVRCHAEGGEGTKASGLDLTSYAGVMKGTKYGPMIVPGEPDSSNLMRLLDWKASPQLRMPHGTAQLPERQRDSIRAWIRQGAKDN
jgi:mono/diheme cytochrome c family protein